MLEPGILAPRFVLSGDDGHKYRLEDFKGKPLIIFFYPKDMTPGCTMEARDFSSMSDDFLAQDAKIVGISKDSLASHISFRSKHSLKIILLSDPDLAVHQGFYAYGQKTNYGKTTLGVIRSTFLIDAEQKIYRAWYNVRVKNHAQSVLQTLKKMNAEGGIRTRTGDHPGRF